MLLDERAHLNGDRLKGMKDIFQPDAEFKPNMLAAYSISFDDGGLVCKITHFSGDEAKVDSKYHFTRDHRVADLWGDMGAAFVLEPLPPVKLHTFFQAASGKSTAGPYRVEHYIGKNTRVFATKCDELYAKHLSAMEKVKWRSAKVDEHTHAIVSADIKNEQTARLDKARSALKEKFLKRKAKAQATLVAEPDLVSEGAEHQAPVV